MSDPFLSLARKWRPRLLADIVGQAYVVRALQSAVRQNRLHHAFLFTGTRGIGKTTLARIVAMLVNCEQRAEDGGEPCFECDSCTAIAAGRATDVIELDAASHTGIDNMRELLESAAYAPARAKYKVFIIDEVHMLSASAFNAMLKTLEEPPVHVKFILATTNMNKVPITVRSRCLCFALLPLTKQQISQRLSVILTAEEVAFQEPAIAAIARLANGSLRDALSILDQAIAHSEGELSVADVRQITGDIGWALLGDTIRAVLDKDAAQIRGVSARHLADNADFDNALARLAATIYKAALFSAMPNTAPDEAEEAAIVAEMAKRLSAEELQVLYEVTLRGRQQLPLSPDAETGFEMTLLRMMLFVPQTPTDATPRDVSPPPSPPSSPPSSSPQQQSQPTPPTDMQATKGQLYDSLSGPSQALFRYCSIEEINDMGIILRVDKLSVAGATVDNFLPDLQADFQKLYGEGFTVQLLNGEDNSGDESYRRELLRQATEHPFMQALSRELPTMRILPESVKRFNKEHKEQ